MINNTNLGLRQKIELLKKQKDILILAHYYQNEDIQDVADFIGDSLELSKKAKLADNKIIAFCGVKFMAETAKILNPTKTVILPDLMAGCSLEQSCQPEDFEKFRQKHKNAIAITYINCSAQIKALSDIICTSSNAEKIINSIPKDEQIIFAPDKNLGSYLIKKTGRDMILWNGSCIIHETFLEKELIKAKTRYPQALIIAHPECTQEILSYADFIGSTSKLLEFISKPENKNQKDFIILTEPGIIHQMKKSRPDANFIPILGIAKTTPDCINCNNCHFMKLNTLEKLYSSMLNLSPQIQLDDSLIQKALKPLERMLLI
jgi:quinolinate synthase